MLSRLPLLLHAFMALLLVGSHAQQDTEYAVRTRTARGTVTLDFGMLLRNILLKSAQLSSAKANVARTTRRPPPPMTTTTPAPPPPPPPPPPPRRRRPIWHPYFASGYLPFDYDSDYADPAVPAPPVPPPPAPPPPAPQPPRRVRPQPRPLGLYNAQRPPARPPPPAPPLPPSYDYDYDYDGSSAAAPAPAPPPPPPPPPPAAAQRPRPRPRPQQPQQPQQRRPAQLGDRLVYQYAQPTDTFSRPLALGGGVAALTGLAGLPEEQQQQQQQQEVDLAATTASGDGGDTGAGAGAGATADGNADAQPERSPPRFLVNYESDGDYFDGGTGSGTGSGPGTSDREGIPPTLDYSGLNRIPTSSNHQQQQQQYFFK